METFSGIRKNKLPMFIQKENSKKDVGMTCYPLKLELIRLKGILSPY